MVVAGLLLVLALPATPGRAQSTVIYAYTANQTSNTVVADVPVGGSSRGVAMSPDGRRVYSASQDTGNVSVIDTVSRTVIATVATGDIPQHPAVSPDGARVYVPNLGSNNLDRQGSCGSPAVARLTSQALRASRAQGVEAGLTRSCER